MKQPKHTPGLWVLMPKDEFGFQIVSMEVYPDALEHIVNLENDVNAHLIAAAPELLEALTKLTQAVEAYAASKGGMDFDSEASLEAAKSIIERVTGDAK